MPRKAVGRQPPRIGPLWEAFCDYWQDAPDGKGRCATAWRAFFAGYMNGLKYGPDTKNPRPFDRGLEGPHTRRKQQRSMSMMLGRKAKIKS